jgi:hypothetical protein
MDRKEEIVSVVHKEKNMKKLWKGGEEIVKFMLESLTQL